MKFSSKAHSQSGFALMITLMLVALLVLSIYALTSVVRLRGQMASSAIFQKQAKQNALMGLNIAVANLQQYAALDSATTGTADIVSSSNPKNSRWTGVWVAGDTDHPVWLVSGEANPSSYDPDFYFDGVAPERAAYLRINANDVILVNNGSTNMASTKYLDGDAVIVPKVSITVSGTDLSSTTIGGYAYWVGDEGVKLSAAYSLYSLPPEPAAQALEIRGASYNSSSTDGFTPSSQVSQVVSYEQLVNAGANATKIRGSFHGVTLTHGATVNGTPVCLININSGGRRLWRGIWQTFKPSAAAAALNAFADSMADHALVWGLSGDNKVLNGPFLALDDFFNPAAGVRDAVIARGEDFSQFENMLRGWMTTRSETFRIRAYGEALNPVPEPNENVGRVESSAYCEAIVQRVKDNPSSNEGRFVVTYFRWLGPDDI